MLKELVNLSNRYGKNGNYVLAGGGNTSYKDENYLYIKGSGTSLATITKEEFVKLNRKKLLDIWNKSYPEDIAKREAAVLSDLMEAREPGEEKKRPSVETLLHNLLPQTYVVHLHPALVNGLTCSMQGKDAAFAIFGEKIIWIDNIEPGYRLAIKVKEKLSEYKKKFNRGCRIILLQNHGVFVSGDNVKEIVKSYKEIIGKISEKISEHPDLTPIEFNQEQSGKIIRELVKNKESAAIVIQNQSLIEIIGRQGQLIFSNAVTPDHIVYCKAFPLLIKKGEDIITKVMRYREQYGYAPRTLIAPHFGTIIWGENEQLVQTVGKIYLDAIKIAVYAESFGGLSLMPQALRDFIMNWEVESYRSSVEG